MTEFNLHVPPRRAISAAPFYGPYRYPARPEPDAAGAHRASSANPDWAPVAFRRKHRGNRLYRRAGKRLFDIAVVLAVAPLSILLIGIAALLLSIEGGNPFYRQDRLGRGGRVFSILKLRTMVRDADRQLESCLAANPAMRREWDATQKLKNDPRITPVGSFLRKTSLDELPQIWNVLTGDMSIVGPRPMLPDQLEMYGDASHYFALKPGITGFWQVSERNEGVFQLRVALDAEYERCLSLYQDFKVLLLTVNAVVRRTGY